MKTIPIRISLLTIFFLTVGVVALTLIGLQYHYSMQLANSAANTAFTETAQKIALHLQARDDKIATILDTAILNDTFAVPPRLGREHPAQKHIIAILEKNPKTYALYAGLSDGSFYEVVNLDSGTALRTRFKAPEKSRWLVIKIVGNGPERAKYFEFIDASGNMIGKRKVGTTQYDPASRLWYTDAVKSPHVIRTDPYLFTHLKAPGITYAVSLPGNRGVLALDITMAHFSDFLAGQTFDPRSEIFLFDRNGEKISSSSHSHLRHDPAAPLPEGRKALKLTDTERAFIAAHPVIRVSNQTDWPPFDFSIGGEPRGFSIDLLELIAQKSGLSFQYINGYTWKELTTLFKAGDIDLLHSVYRNADREQWGTFTQPMFRFKSYVITRSDAGLESIQQLKGKRVALPEGWSTIDYLQWAHPDIKIVTVPKAIDAYMAVAEGRADATIDNAMTMRYLTAKHQLDTLHAAFWFRQIDGDISQTLHMLIRPDLIPLRTILDKGLDALTSQEIQALENRWLNTEQPEPSGTFKNDVVSTAYLNAVKQHKNRLVTFEDNGVATFGYATTFASDLGISDRIGMRIPEAVVLAPYLDKVTIALLVAFAILAAAVPMVLYGTQLIIRPIRLLMVENDKIRQRRYNAINRVDTHISELDDLSISLVAMAESIRTHEQAQEQMFDAVIRLIADAIDAKSPYTGGHCQRVPEIAMMLAEAAEQADKGPFSTFRFASDEARREFKIGAWLHDCGKVTTPEYVVDKATKLETIYNRIHEIRTRFEVLWRDLELEYHRRCAEGETAETLQQWLETERQQLQDDFAFLAECNTGEALMNPERILRLHEIGRRTWMRHFDNRLGISEEEARRFSGVVPSELPVREPLLSDRPEQIVPREHFDEEAYRARGFTLDVPEHLYNYGECHNLCVERGTLTSEERFKINEHVIMTLKMLEKLPLPEGMERIPEYAGTHHEAMDGSGYPRGLSAAELSIPARIMAIADIFEALTARDRPYKTPNTLSEALAIMQGFSQKGHIDPDLFKLFLTSGVYLDYARAHLTPEQIDDVRIETYFPRPST